MERFRYSVPLAATMLLAACSPGHVRSRDGGLWRPVIDQAWDWQLLTPIDPTAMVDVYDIDMFDNNYTVVDDLHARGRKVICYIDVGSWESYRPDADLVPPALRGAIYKGFPNENWLDVRQITQLTPMVSSRFDMAYAMGCAGIEPDNLDGYDTMAHEMTGFPLTYADQINYNTFIAQQAHARGMAVCLKNDTRQAADLQPHFDCVVSEQCFQYNECGLFASFTAANKPIFEAEYTLMPAQYCPMAKALHISAIRKNAMLDSYRVGCP